MHCVQKWTFLKCMIVSSWYEYYDIAWTIQLTLKVSMNVCQGIWNRVVELLSIEDHLTKKHVSWIHTYKQVLCKIINHSYIILTPTLIWMPCYYLQFLVQISAQHWLDFFYFHHTNAISAKKLFSLFLHDPHS